MKKCNLVNCSIISKLFCLTPEQETMRITIKGQITIPKHIREKLGH